MNATTRNAIARQVSAIQSRQLTWAQTRVATAIAHRWDGELPTPVVVAAAIDLDAQGPQWAFKIERGYFLDVVRDAIDKATA
mgnify:CR=1 FL=1